MFKTGFEALQEMQSKFKYQGDGQIRLFYVKPGSERHVVFIDDVPHCFMEHHYRLDGKWGHRIPCIAEISEKGCPMCATPYRSCPVGYLTIVVVEKINGQLTYQKLLLRMPPRAASIIQYEFESQGGKLRGKLYKVYRTTQDAINIGDIWKYVKDVNMENIPENMREPFNYKELFKMPTYEEVEATAVKILQGSAPEFKKPKTGSSEPVNEDELDF